MPRSARRPSEIYGQLTRAAAPGSRLIVWPEAAVPAYLRFEPGAMQWLIDLAAAVRVPLLVGAPDAEREGRRTRYLNSAFYVDAAGVRARYDKMHLVPFGEYVPLKRLLFFVEAIAAEIGDFTPGREATLFQLEGTPFGTVICYEVIFPDLFRRFVAGGASFMTNITNDAWFGDSGGPLQHLQWCRSARSRTVWRSCVPPTPASRPWSCRRARSSRPCPSGHGARCGPTCRSDRAEPSTRASATSSPTPARR